MDERFLVCDEKDWDGMTPEQRDWLVFKTIRSMDARLKKLELWNRFFSFVGGMIGGAASIVGIKLFG